MAMMFRVLHPLIWPTLATVVVLVLMQRGRVPVRRRCGGRRCRRCDYALRGLPETSTRCPECGADLTHRRAIATGIRIARWKVRLACLPLLIGTLWWGYRLLTPERRLVLTPPAVLMKDPSLWTKADQLAPWQVRSVFRRGLALQVDPANAQQPFPWMAFSFIIARRSNEIDPKLIEQYFHNTAQSDLTVRPAATQGDPVPLQAVTARYGPTSYRLELKQASIDGQPVRPRTSKQLNDLSNGPLFGQTISTVMLIDPEDTKHLSPGQHTLSMKMDLTYDVNARRTRRETTISKRVTILPADTPSVALREPGSDPSLASALVCTASNRLDIEGNPCIEVTADLRSAGLPFCFDVLLETNGKSRLIGIMYSSADRSSMRFSKPVRFNWTKQASYRVTLRPNPRIAALTTDLTVISGESLSTDFPRRIAD